MNQNEDLFLNFMAIDLFITEIKTEFKDDNWDYLEFIKERVLNQLKNK